MKKPNILFAFADDWGRYASCYAEVQGDNSLSALVNTPNVDRVAAEGVMFTNAFVPAPTCTPCRSSVLSGRYFWQTGLGAILLGAVWDRAVPSYPFMLEEAGYHIGFSYKVWSPGTPADDPYGGADRRYQSGGGGFGNYSFVVTKKSEELGGVEAAKQYLDKEVLGNFEAFLDDREGDKPFCYWWGPTNTHRRWQRGSGKNLWNLEPDDLKGRLPDFLPDTHTVREDVCDYLGECMAFDRGLGVILKKLEETGELDNTLVVVSGDHGIPGFPRAKCNLYDIGCEVALLARMPNKIKAGRKVDDMVNIMDLAPTFLEAAGVEPHPEMPARSLMPLLEADGDGQIDPERKFVITGRERHVATAREWNLPYPQRAIRTKTHIYIRNFKPDRWPMGDPKGLDDYNAEAPAFELLEHETYTAYADMDAGPTKAWMVHHRAEDEVQNLFDIGFGKRPAEELYDLRTDPHYMNNLAGDPAHEEVRAELSKLLMDELVKQKDPRVVEEDCRFEKAPFTDVPEPADQDKEKRLAVLASLPKL